MKNIEKKRRVVRNIMEFKGRNQNVTNIFRKEMQVIKEENKKNQLVQHQ